MPLVNLPENASLIIYRVLWDTGIKMCVYCDVIFQLIEFQEDLSAELLINLNMAYNVQLIFN